MRKIILAGADSPRKQNFKRELERQCTENDSDAKERKQQCAEYRTAISERKQQCGGTITISEDLDEACAEDLVFLFAQTDRQPEQQTGQSAGLQAEQMEAFDHLLEQLLVLSRKRPAATVLLSDSRVYGKVFGEPGARSEHELGYVCHTSAEDTAAANLRTAENLAYRLAGEGMKICIARMNHATLDVQESDGDAGQSVNEQMSAASNGGEGLKNGGSEAYASAVHAALQVLLYGAPGAVYNLPGSDTTGAQSNHPGRATDAQNDPSGTTTGAQNDHPGITTGAQAAPHSPLSPEPVYLDISAVEALENAGLR
jgi:hypothetical protein